MPVFARNAVATSNPLAAQAGLRMMLRGGNAVDAALASAIALTVVEPTSNGIGSDAFAIVWDGNKLYGLNGSGRSPEAWTPDRFARCKRMPQLGWDTVTVPGAVDLWSTLSRKFGSLPFRDLFEPAMEYAARGFMVGPVTSERWKQAQKTYRDYPDFSKTFLPEGQAPSPGEWFHPPGFSDTLKILAETHGESLYHGALAERLASFSRITGGCMTEKDLAEHRTEWVNPLSVHWNGVDLYELPPNGQGLAVLIALGILKHLSIEEVPVDSTDSIHLQVEAMKRAFAVSQRQIADPLWMTVEPSEFLKDDFLRKEAESICREKASYPSATIPHDGGTVYLTAADEKGRMVSYIQSNYMGFGSGIVIPGTGISLQNRGMGFALERDHPNRVAGKKRPFHTIIPGFVMKDGCALMSFGVMGAHMQAQGHIQMMVRIFAGRQNPQTALDAPRWYLDEHSCLSLENGFGPDIRQSLIRRGHLLKETAELPVFGGGQILYRMNEGYCAGSDPRKDGQAVGY